MHRLTGRVAIVTGAARGIGFATAQRLAAEGAHVVITDVDGAAAAEAAQTLGRHGARAVGIAGNVASAADCEAAVERAVGAFGGVDILVNNAGITRDRVIHKMSEAEWDAVMDVHLRGAWNMARAVAPHFRAQEPAYHRKVVSLSSVNGLDGAPGQTNYAAAKAGLIGFTKALAIEWARHKVNVNAVAPGFIDTRMTAPHDPATGMGLPEGKRDMMLAFLPWGMGRPEDIAAAIAFLASPDSDYITGEVLRVAGPPPSAQL